MPIYSCCMAAFAKLSCLLTVLVFLSEPAPTHAAPAAKKVVLIAGSLDSHPKESHEYEKNIILLKHCLDTSPNLKGIRTELHFNGWPEDPATLDDADTIFLTSGGSDRNESDHPLYVGGRFQALRKQMERGCGLVLFHWSTFNPVRVHDQITDWIGGYFDYETGPGPRRWYSAIQTWDATAFPGAPGHPISRGVNPFPTREEYYYKIRFREEDPRLKPILLTRPPNEPQDHVVGWAVERANGGRGFGFTGGHFYANWWTEDFRKLVLNAIAWTAHAEVPEQGVASKLGGRIRALILTGHDHPAHDWRANTAAMIQVLELDPRVQVHVTEKPEDLAGGILKEQDLLLLCYNNWDRPGLSELAKENLAGFLRQGGGLAVIHFANGAFNAKSTVPNKESDWPEYRTQIVRRTWEEGSGHDNFGPFRVEITRVNHPITQGLGSFDTVDELYFRQAGQLPIEPLAVAFSKVTQKNEPMAWAYTYGQGRVFQTVLGHAAQSIHHAGALIRRGAVWAAKRDPLSFDPPLEIAQRAPFRPRSPWTPEESLKAAPLPEKKTSHAPEVQKQAAHSTQASRPETATAQNQAPSGDPTLQTDDDWIDGRWNETDVGQFLGGAIQTHDPSASKAVAIRVGESKQGAVCFDTELLRYSAGWTGGFLRFNERRYGLIQPPVPDGQVVFTTAAIPGWARLGSFDDPRSMRRGSLPKVWGHYRGLYRSGPRTILSYSIGANLVLDSPWIEASGGLTVFTRTLEINPASEEMRVVAAQFDKGSIHLDAARDFPVARQERGGQWMAVAVAGPGASLRLEPNAVVSAAIEAHKTSIRLKLFIASGTPEEWPKFEELVRRSPAPRELSLLTDGGPAQWNPPLVTKGQLGGGAGPFAIDTLALPFDNPWKALFFASGHDFFDNGDIALCTAHGDVWRVGGIDAKLERLTWRRYATGLYQPLGLKIVNNQVHVIERGQLTRLHDFNQDGEADYYENFNNDILSAAQNHAFAACLETDPEGNFYFLKCAEKTPHGGTLLKTPADGSRLEVVATGFRNPNGLGVSPSGLITVADQQGNWVPETRLDLIQPGGFYGFMPMHHRSAEPAGYDGPLCWIPRAVDNSAGGQVWVPKGEWGPFSEKMIHLSYGRCTMMLVLMDEQNPTQQGAVAPLPGRFLSGVMRARFHPADAHLYVSGMRGWQTAAVMDGCLQRVRFIGLKTPRPAAFAVHRNGIRLTFSEELNSQQAADVENYSLEQWNYRWSSEYGSPELSAAHPGQEGRDKVRLKSARLLPDQRSVLLEIPGLQPVMVLGVRYSLDSAQGELFDGEIYLTIHETGSELLADAAE